MVQPDSVSWAYLIISLIFSPEARASEEFSYPYHREDAGVAVAPAEGARQDTATERLAPVVPWSHEGVGELGAVSVRGPCCSSCGSACFFPGSLGAWEEVLRVRSTWEHSSTWHGGWV